MDRKCIPIIAALFLALTGCESESPCEGISCSGLGRCALLDDAPVCACDEGAHPEALSCVPDGESGVCSGVTCSDHGVCVDTGDRASCRCEPGFYPVDLRCEPNVDDGGSDGGMDGSRDSGDAALDPCEDEDCSGHGQCRVDDGEAACMCDDGYSPGASLSCETATNPYLEPVAIPIYDSENPAHFVIRTDEDWSHINDPEITAFFVEPGDYTDLGDIVLTQSGTADQRRSISLHNGNDTHPGRLARAELALYELTLDHADYWVIDRQAALSGGGILAMTNASSHNVANRMFTDDVGQCVFIGHQSNDNVIQRSRFQDMRLRSRKGDTMCILLQFNRRGWSADYVEIRGTRVIENEIVNQNDGLHVTRTAMASMPDIKQTGNMEGTIIDGNRIWVTPAIYVNAEGMPDPTYRSMYAENAIDIKIGSANPDNPMVISNNIMWGYVPASRVDSHLSANGIAVGTHFGVDNLHFVGNVVFDSFGGFGSGDRRDATYALQFAEIADNLFVRCSSARRRNYSAISLFQDNGSSVHDNTMVGGENGPIIARSNTASTTSMGNTFIGTPPQEVEGPGSYGPNTTYTLTQAEEAGYTGDLLVHYDQYTTEPQVIVLENVVLE